MMKRIVTLLILVAFVLSLQSAADNYQVSDHVSSQQITTQSGTRADAGKASTREAMAPRRNETIFYQQDFNDGWGEWETLDLTTVAHMWHLTDWNAFGGTGNSWWVGDPDLGGYISRQYLVLDTPEIEVTTGNSNLTFKLNYATEPIGSSPSFPDYNGWDGCNVRISTDGGDTWSVISGTPAYDATSMFSFGHIHHEGPDVPGWGGTSDGWVDASFDLSNYVGQDVQIRFAFASDGGLDVTTNPDWFGMMVDNISLGAFDHNFNDGNEQGMTYSSMVLTGGDLWHIDTTTPLPPSPPNAAICQNDQGSYNAGMYNFLISPSITLPESGDIRVDFMIRGDIDSDDNAFPDTDYWGWQISPDDGENWYAMSNPYDDPDGDNFVYLTPDTMWGSATASYSLDGYISDYAGETVKFRLFLRTNLNDPVGEGIMIDDYTVYHAVYLPAPTNLTAEIVEQEVYLEWSAPGGGGSEGWIHWDDGVNNDGIGLQDGGSIDVAARFSPTDLEPYVYGYITTMKVFPREAGPLDLKIWTGPSGNQLLYEETVTPTANQWNEIVLSEPVLISMGTDYWIGYTVEHDPGEWPAGCDAGPHIPGKGDMIRTGASWTSLFDSSAGTIDVNWNIQALVEILDQTATINLNSRDVTGYNVYHSTTSGDGYELAATVTETTFIHNDPTAGAVNYYVVSALYDEGESGYSNEAQAFVLPSSSTVFAYDDGEAESGYNAGVNNHVAVKFLPGIEGEVQLTHLNIYIHTLRTGAMVIKIWDDADGVPGNLLGQFVYPATQIREGWNIIPIPPANPIILTEDFFFAGIQESATASAVGVDEDNVGSSYTKIGANPWSPFVNGNLMIRAILDGPTNVNEELLPASEKITLTNYPNPFNPVTTIELNLPQETKVGLKIYNSKGQLVTTLIDEFLARGSYNVVWDGKDNKRQNVASGVYFYRLETETETGTRRMLLLK
jgi:hypothetical protein